MKNFYLFIFSLSMLSIRITAQCTTPSLVPYYESFSNLNPSNQLPSCWAVSNTVTCLTSTWTTNNYAEFYHLPAGTSYFYSNGIQLLAGVTYSVACWFKVDPSPTIGWTGFYMALASSQTITGAMPVASVSPVVQTAYTALSNTFNVSTSGVYYLAIGATSNGTASSAYLSWDDLAITIPCSLNSPTISIVYSSSVICAGDQEVMIASGADTYSWSTSSYDYSITATPFQNTNYQVVGTNTLTGCSSTASLAILVKPLPSLFIFTNTFAICPGQSVNLTASGAFSYVWSSGDSTSLVQVSPTVSTTYTVIGTANNGCINSATQHIVVYPAPVIAYTISANHACIGDMIQMDASGAAAYQWETNFGTFQGPVFSFTLSAPVTVTLVGSDVNDCSSQKNIVVAVNGCTGLQERNPEEIFLNIYPNPCSDLFNVEYTLRGTTVIELRDMIGRMVLQRTETNGKSLFDLSMLPAGVYQLTVSSGSGIASKRIVKE